ncbi:hypothetical protein FACS1894147_00970 [Spirochaetia bacterium]|nr:hypothetical protein FACS1894147_00970 [Spirochaetia bacterium]
MVQQPSKLTEKARISRFWAFYRLLSEPLKDGFIGIAQGVAHDYEKDEQRRKGQDGKERQG